MRVTVAPLKTEKARRGSRDLFDADTSIADGEKLIGQAIHAGLERGFAISGVDKC
jgi:hypothetical protein